MGSASFRNCDSYPDGEKLADFLLGRHPAQRLVGPLSPGFVEMDRTGPKISFFALVFSKAQHRGEQERGKKKISDHAIDNSKSGRGTSSSRLTRLSNLRLDGCNGFRLDGRVIAKPG